MGDLVARLSVAHRLGATNINSLRRNRAYRRRDLKLVLQCIIWQYPRMSTSPAAPQPSIVADAPTAEAAPVPPAAMRPTRPLEIGGPKGPEPTRYGDWERAGRCVDF